MNNFLRDLLRLGISVSLTEREEFVQSTSEFLANKLGSDPEDNQGLGERIYETLDLIREELKLEKILSCERENSDQIVHELADIKQLLAELNERLKK